MLPIQISAKLARVFYDRSQVHPWSVDIGSGTAELNVKEVWLEGTSGKFTTGSMDKDPKAWVEFANVELTVWLDGAKIKIKHTDKK